MANSNSYTKQEVRLAIGAMSKVWQAEPTRNVKTLASQLEREMDAGEFDGTMDSAILCLECAGFDIVEEDVV